MKATDRRIAQRSNEKQHRTLKKGLLIGATVLTLALTLPGMAQASGAAGFHLRLSESLSLASLKPAGDLDAASGIGEWNQKLFAGTEVVSRRAEGASTQAPRSFSLFSQEARIQEALELLEGMPPTLSLSLSAPSPLRLRYRSRSFDWIFLPGTPPAPDAVARLQAL